MITSENILKHELIGLEAEIVESSNPSQIGIRGRVIDETRQTLTLEVSDKPKSFVKDQCKFRFILPDRKRVMVRGELLVSRPEDRIKKKQKKW